MLNRLNKHLIVTIALSFSFSMPQISLAQSTCAQVLVAPAEPAVNRAGESKAQVEQRLQSAQSLIFKIADGRQMFVQVIAPANDKQITFLLLPGVNRGMDIKDTAAQMLASLGFGVVTLHFSTHPLSVLSLPEKDIPFFMNHTVVMQDLADDVQGFSENLKKIGLENIVPVSLSYSGAVSPHLKGFPLIIETVPMTSSAATNTGLEIYRQSLIAAELFNPIFGPAITRNLLDGAYRQKWSGDIDGMTKDSKISSKRKAELVEGYVSMSRAAEGSSWEGLELVDGPRRIFLLAGKESPALLKNQIQVVQKLLKERQDVLVFFVADSGHVIPSEQPIAYVSALNLAVDNQAKATSGIFILNSQSQKLQYIEPAKADDFLDSILKELN